MLTVTTLETEPGWDELAPVWNALLERSASASPFLTWEWLRAWWRCYRTFVGATSLHILVAADSGGVVGIAPLYRGTAPGYGLGSLRCLRFIGAGTEDSEYLDFIVEAGREAEVAGAFVDHLAGEPWDFVELDLVRAGSPALAVVRDRARYRGFRLLARDFECTALDLPPTWEEYLNTLRPRFRTRVRSLLRRLPAEHSATFERCDEPDQLAGELDHLFEMHQARWRAAGAPGSFSLPERRAFYHGLAAGFLERGWLRLFRLRVAGRPAAYEFSFEYGGRVYYLQQAHDPEYAKLSVGTALKAFVLRDCIESRVDAYDFLGDAAEHKLSWGARIGRCTRLWIARPGLRVRWGLWLPRFAREARARIRAAVPEPVAALKRRVQDRARSALRRASRVNGASPGG